MSTETGTRSSAAEQVLAVIAGGGACPAETLMPLFEQLPPIRAEEMIGMWKGGLFDGGTEPDPINWYGKRFVSSAHVDPLMCTGEDGALYSYQKLGVAQLREVAFQGVTSASLIYDKQPIMDYFRKVTDDVVLGLGDIKGKPLDFFFHLTRE
jgi:hypothetical protein